MKPQSRRRDSDTADLVVLDPLEHTTLVHMRVVHDLAEVAERGTRDAVPFGEREHLHLSQGVSTRQ